MQREVCNSLSEGTRFHQSCPSSPEHQDISDGILRCCWWHTGVFKIFAQLAVAVMSRRTRTIPEKHFVFSDCFTVFRSAPWPVIGASRHFVGTRTHVVATATIIMGTPRQVIGAPRCSQVHPTFSLVLQGVLILITITVMVLLYQSSWTPITLNAGWNDLQGSNTLPQLPHLSLHSISCQTLWKASSNFNTFYWWTVLCQLSNLDLSGRSLKWNFADWFKKQCYPLLGSWVWDQPEHVTVTQVSYG
jgi:hypothetical protein